MPRYKIQAVEIGESPELASVCAVWGSTVYENPRFSGVRKEQAEAEVARLVDEGKITSGDIERDWKQI